MQIVFNESQTKINLMSAFAGECQARHRYYFAALTAQEQNLIGLERIFRFTAEQEERHAKQFYELMKDASGTQIRINADFPVDVSTDLKNLLESAEKAEKTEFSEVYPNFAQIASQEGFFEIQSKFNLIAKIEENHLKRFEYYAKLMREDKLFRSDSSEQRWMCLNCGHIHTGSEPPESCPVCGAQQGYFIREEEAAFTSPTIIV